MILILPSTSGRSPVDQFIDLRDDMIYEILPFFEIDVKVGMFESAILLKESA